MPNPMVLQDLHESQNLFTERVECAVAICTLLQAWAKLENELATVFGMTTGEAKFSFGTPGSGFSFNLNPISTSTLRVLDGLRPRLDVVEAGIKVKLGVLRAREFREIANHIRKVAIPRNKAAHTLWWLHGAYPTDLFAEVDGHTWERWSTADFLTSAERIHRVAKELIQFGISCLGDLAGGG